MISHSAASAHAQWDEAVAQAIVSDYAAQEGAALPMLHALQEKFGFVPRACEQLVAAALNISRAEVHGIISFYHDFRRTPPGRHVLKICRAEACQAVGGVALAEGLLNRLGIDWGETGVAGGLTVEPVYCLGLCACAPAALFDGEPRVCLDDSALAGMIEQASLL